MENKMKVTVVDVFLTPEEEKRISDSLDQDLIRYAKREGLIDADASNFNTEELCHILKQHLINKKTKNNAN